VVEKQLASDAGASYDGYSRDDGEFAVYAVPRPGIRLDLIERAIDDIIADASGTQPNSAELTRAKTQLVAAAVYRRDSQYEMASAYGQALAIGLTADDVEQWPERIRAVSANAVRDAAAKRLVKKDAVTGYLLPEGEGKP
jgi:zinc protease